MTGIIARAVTSLLKKSTDGPAKTTIRGISGSIGIPILLLPVICIVLFSWFGWLGSHDPDQQDRLTGFGVLGLAGILVLYLFHLLSFRIFATDKELITGSLLTKERVIHLDETFAIQENEDGDSISIYQGKTKSTITWIIKGHWDFHELILEAHHRISEG